MDYRDKIINLQEAVRRREKLGAAGLRFIFTNGCFDLLHPGHLRYLAEARALGDYLLVGLNSDRSIQAIKGGKALGPPRPICPQAVRAEMLAGLAAVDAVLIFDEDTPFELVKSLRPDILVKGGDWPPDKIVGSDLVLQNGGQVKSLPLAEGFSTTALVERIIGGK